MIERVVKLSAEVDAGTFRKGYLFPAVLRFSRARRCVTDVDECCGRNVANDFAGCRIANFDNVSL